MSEGNQRILIVEDNWDIRELIKLYLTKYKYHVFAADTGEKAFELWEKEQPDLILLDVLLPDMEGFEVCSRIRQQSKVPILFLSSKTDSQHIIKGLEIGADDYITKPFDPNVLIAKVRANLRRISFDTLEPKETILRVGNLAINTENYETYLNGKIVSVSAKELQLLLFLAQNPNKVYNVDQLYAAIWDNMELGDTRTVMVHIRNLRKKLEDDPSNPKFIVTVRGFGYKFQPEG